MPESLKIPPTGISENVFVADWQGDVDSNTRGVVQKKVEVDAKLNKARVRRGKTPIPPYRRVESKNYVTLVMERIERVRKPPTGTHASPVMHMRLGHWRNYQTGQRSFIRDTLVNASDEARAEFLLGRSHYKVQGGKA